VTYKQTIFYMEHGEHWSPTLGSVLYIKHTLTFRNSRGCRSILTPFNDHVSAVGYMLTYLVCGKSCPGSFLRTSLFEYKKKKRGREKLSVIDGDSS
jgi:hypothetical protein